MPKKKVDPKAEPAEEKEASPVSMPTGFYGAIVDPIQVQWMITLYGAHPWSYHQVPPDKMLKYFDPPLSEESSK